MRVRSRLRVLYACATTGAMQTQGSIRLRKHREAHGLTRRKFALAHGFSPVSVGEWEGSGKRPGRPSAAKRFELETATDGDVPARSWDLPADVEAAQ